MDNVEHPEDFSEFVIGGKYPVLKANNAKTNASASLSMISQARRSIDIYTATMDPQVLDSAEIADAIIKFVKVSPNSKMRILVADAESINKQGHRLLELSRKFSSFIAIRKINEEYQSTAHSLLIIDKKALIHRPHCDEYHAIVNFNAAYECRQHLEFFNEVWQRSEVASEIRQLFI